MAPTQRHLLSKTKFIESVTTFQLHSVLGHYLSMLGIMNILGNDVLIRDLWIYIVNEKMEEQSIPCFPFKVFFVNNEI